MSLRNEMGRFINGGLGKNESVECDFGFINALSWLVEGVILCLKMLYAAC